MHPSLFFFFFAFKKVCRIRIFFLRKCVECVENGTPRAFSKRIPFESNSLRVSVRAHSIIMTNQQIIWQIMFSYFVVSHARVAVDIVVAIWIFLLFRNQFRWCCRFRWVMLLLSSAAPSLFARISMYKAWPNCHLAWPQCHKLSHRWNLIEMRKPTAHQISVEIIFSAAMQWR